jgi:hypothetical protein
MKPKRMRWAEHVARMETKVNAYMILVEKPEGTGQVGRPRYRWGVILKWLLER